MFPAFLLTLSLLSVFRVVRDVCRRRKHSFDVSTQRLVADGQLHEPRSASSRTSHYVATMA